MKTPPPSRLSFVAAFAGLLLLMASFVSNQSFWIDEIRTGVKAFQPSLPLFWDRMTAFAGADICVQMPLYMVLEWCWEKLVGPGEWALRSLNALFAAGALAALATERALPRRIRLWTALFLATSPMSAEYMDEARPYVLLLLASTLALCGALRFDGIGFGDGRGGRARFLAGVAMLCAASLTGVPFAAALCACLAFRAARSGTFRACLRANAAAFALAGAVLAALGAWYAWTLRAGYGGRGPAGTTPATIAFDAYELLGFLGLGPGRSALRSASASVFFSRARFLPLLLLLAGAYAGFLASGIRALRGGARPCLPRGLPNALAGAAIGCLALVATGLVAHSRILARHLVPALPPLLLLLACLADSLWRARPDHRIWIAALLSLLLASSLAIRFSPIHAKDDYRRAARIATEAIRSGRCVWWAADAWAPEFYGIPDSPVFRSVSNRSSAELHDLPRPDVVLFSKPDIYDRSGSICGRLRSLGLAPASSLPGFTLWRPAPPPILRPPTPCLTSPDL